jgi:hypothetical protein
MERFLYVETPAAGDLLLPVGRIRCMLQFQRESNITEIFMTNDVKWIVNHSVAEIASAINRTPATNPLIRVTEKPLPQSSLEREA